MHHTKDVLTVTRNREILIDTGIILVIMQAFILHHLLGRNTKFGHILGKNAMYDLVRRLPGGDGVDGITDNTISGILCAILEIITGSTDNARSVREAGGGRSVISFFFTNYTPRKMIGHRNIKFNLDLISLQWYTVVPVFMLRWPMFFLFH